MGKQLFIGNINYDATEDNLKAAFESDGFGVAAVKIMRDEESVSRGFGFVTLKDGVDADKAIEQMRDCPVLGRKIRVEMAQQPAKRA